ncbi:22724_t:CDS:2, partial [Gigaspora rosea]
KETSQIGGSSPNKNSTRNKNINHDYTNTIAEKNDLIKSLQERVNQLQTQSSSKKKVMRTKLITTGYTRRPKFQKLLKKATIIENENSESKKYVESLESNVAEGEINLTIAKDQLTILQKEKQDYMELIKRLSEQLNETQMQIENAKYSVKEEQKVMENILDEERKAKLKAEKARLALETQMEQIMNKKR